MNSILLFGLFIYVLSLVCFAHKHAKMNESNIFAFIKDYKYAHLIQYEDFDHKHRIFNISTNYNGSSYKFLAKVYFSLNVDNDSYDLDLVLNSNLLSKSYGITTYSKFGKHTSNNSQEGKACSYYQGSIRNAQGSKVFVSMCKEFRAIFVLVVGVFNVEPLGNDTDTYIFYKSEVSHFKNYFCPELFTHSLNDFFLVDLNQTNVQLQIKKQLIETDEEFAYAELVVIASKSTCNALSGDRDDIENYIKSVVNVVDGYYQEMNVHVVLVHIELWLEKDYFQTGSTATETLGSFADHRKNQIRQDPESYWNTADAIFVIHNKRFDSVSVGIATVDSICTSFAHGICRYKRNPALTAITLTHELGHNLGLLHVNDGNPKRVCSCVEGECIMNPFSRFSSKQVWSECSLRSIRNRFAMDAYGCLSNIPEPSSLVFGSGCGNTIVEKGEQCDCGSRGNCKSKCCNPDTCQLVPKATCDTGLCCENCQLLAEGVICRENLDECDLPDVCSGTSPYCPQNIYKEDGTSCLNGQAYCYEGACVSRDMLCKEIYGPLSSAPDRCYDANAYGRQGGNCGFDSNSVNGYRACAGNDRFCGKLLCFGHKGPVTGNIYLITWPNTGCYTLSVAQNSTSESVSIVPDGTACGAKMNCRNFECQRIAASKCNPPCIESVCDNLGYCRCENGELCEHSPTGPSEQIVGIVKGFAVLEIFVIIATNILVALIVIGCSTAYTKFYGVAKNKNTKLLQDIDIKNSNGNKLEIFNHKQRVVGDVYSENVYSTTGMYFDAF